MITFNFGRILFFKSDDVDMIVDIQFNKAERNKHNLNLSLAPKLNSVHTGEKNSLHTENRNSHHQRIPINNMATQN